jgi:hypothetical protein
VGVRGENGRLKGRLKGTLKRIRGWGRVNVFAFSCLSVFSSLLLEMRLWMGIRRAQSICITVLI